MRKVTVEAKYLVTVVLDDGEELGEFLAEMYLPDTEDTKLLNYEVKDSR
jgi:hypothetical protein